MKRLINAAITLALFLLGVGCTGTPDGVSPITNFQLQPYLGTWYEIARLDHSFERDLTNVTATYTMRDDGGVKVLNQGYHPKDRKWNKATGKAYFKSEPNVGHLKVAFFGPFYASYVIFELDDQYQYAFVTGNNRDYLWLLSRTPEVSDELKQQFVKSASELGYATDKLIWVDQSENVARLRDEAQMKRDATEQLPAE